MYDSGRQKVRKNASSLILFLFFSLLTGLFLSLLPLHLIGRNAGARSPMAKSWLVRALVPGHLHVQGPRLLAMARHLAGYLRTRHYDSRMDDLRRSARRNPGTSSTSRLGRTTSIIVSLYLFLSWFHAVILPDRPCFPIRCSLSPGSSPTTCIIIPSSRDRSTTMHHTYYLQKEEIAQC